MEQITRKAELKRLIKGHQTDAMANACDRLRDDDDIIFFDIEHGAENYEFYSNNFKNSEYIILKCLEKKPELILKVPEKYRTKKTYLQKAFKANPKIYIFLDEEIQINPEYAKLYFGHGMNFTLNSLSESIKDNYDIVLIAVSENLNNFKYASERLRDNETILKAVIKQSGYSIKFTSDRLKADKDIVLEAVTKDGQAYEYISERLKNDDEVFLAAVKQNGIALIYAPNKYKDNKAIALIALQTYFQSYEVLSPALKEDRDIIKATIKSMPACYLYDYTLQHSLGKSLTEDLKKDKAFIRELVDINPSIILNEIVSDDAEMLLLAIEYKPSLIDSVKKKYINDTYFITECYRKNPDILELLNKAYRYYMYDNIFTDEKSMIALAKVNPKILDKKEIPQHLRKSFKESYKKITSPNNPDYKKELFKDFKGYLKYQFSSDKEVSGLIESLKSLKSYNSLVEALASQYTFSPSAAIKDKAEEYLEFLKFDMSKIDEVLY